MNRLQTRIDAAIARASRRYFSDHKLYFVSPSGRRREIEGIFKTLGADADVLPRGAALNTARRELVVTRRTFQEIEEFLEREQGGDVKKTLRASTFIEQYEKENVVWKIDGAFPIDENTPDRSSARFHLVRSGNVG